MVRIASATGVPWATSTSTWRSYLAQLGDNLFRLVSLPRHGSVLLWLRSHTSGRTTSKREDQLTANGFRQSQKSASALAWRALSQRRLAGLQDEAEARPFRNAPAGRDGP